VRFGWDLGDPDLTANRTQAVEVSDELRDRIALDNAFDVELYEFARRVLGRASRPHALVSPT
jgi:hypothetical protein